MAPTRAQLADGAAEAAIDLGEVLGQLVVGGYGDGEDIGLDVPGQAAFDVQAHVIFDLLSCLRRLARARRGWRGITGVAHRVYRVRTPP